MLDAARDISSAADDIVEPALRTSSAPMRCTYSAISFNQFYFQQPAGLNENGELEFCAACPDATIRNGLVVPVCVADVLSPVIEKGPNDEKRNRMLLDLGLDSINVPKAG